MVLFYLAVALFAACPVLHYAVHADASQPGHQCAATILAQGHLELPVCDAPFCPPQACGEATELPQFSDFSATIRFLPLGRAPPAA